MFSKIHNEFLLNWNCISKNKIKHDIDLKTAESCPKSCHEFLDCQSCLKSKGSEGGSHECRWATHLNQCIAPSYQPLYCSGGVCGLVIQPKQIDQCPSPCFNFTQCDECLQHAHCGWCGNTAGNGDGVCSEGSVNLPLNANCVELYSKVYTNFTNAIIDWYFVHCPPENECENGHHKCNASSENCHNLVNGYECICGSGYRNGGGICIPVCSQGCVRGVCTRPGVCNCDFGYVGANCSIQCQCNGHSNCEGPDKLDQCITCHNNTVVNTTM